MIHILFFFTFNFFFSLAQAESAVEFKATNSKPCELTIGKENLIFEPEKNNIKLIRPRFDFSITEDSQPLLGPLNGTYLAVSAQLFHIPNEDTPPILWFNWPKELIEYPLLTVIDSSGTILYESQLTKENQSEWENSEVLTALKAINPQFSKLSSHGFGFLKTPSFLSDLQANSKLNFNFCVSFEDDQGKMKLCSNKYLLKQSSTLELIDKSEHQAPRILVNGLKVDSKGSIPLMLGQKYSLIAQLANGQLIQSEFKILEPQLQEVVLSTNGEQRCLRGHGNPPWPLRKSIEPEPSFMDSTIGTYTLPWMLALTPETPTLYFQSTGGLYLSFDLSAPKGLPRESDHIVLNEKLLFTYADTVNIPLTLPDGFTLFNEQKDSTTQVAKVANPIFWWTFKTEEPGRFATKDLILEKNLLQWTASHSLFRSYSNEFSIRTSGVLTANYSLNLVGEMNFNSWFETILGSQNPWFSFQRWGVSAKVFQPIKKLLSPSSLKQSQNSTDLSLTMATLKYRLSPGVWEKQATVGLLLGYESFSLGNVSASLMGYGLFWARSMPAGIDRFLHLFSWLRYPKWVDLDFIYYPMSLKKSIQPLNNFSLNFHGKILWRPSFFGEAGFGMQSYYIKDLAIGYFSRFQAFYGTVGLGFNF